MAKKKDEGHIATDKTIEAMENRIAKEYAQAEAELTEKLEEYLNSFATKDKLKRQALAKGLITQEEYEKWKVGQIAIGKRWEEMRDTISEDLSNSSKIAKSITYGYMAEIYALNYNYGTYQVEKASHVDTSFTMYDKHTVENIFKTKEPIYHKHGKKVGQHIKEGKLERWEQSQVNSVMLQSILQGESIGNMATRLHDQVGDSILAEDIKNANKMTAEQISKELIRKNRNASIRNARTMATGVENAGRIAAYQRAEDMGIKMEQEWVATLDNRTRHEHRLLDGQRVAVGEKFEVEGYQIAYPGDPMADAEMVYNCRCTLIAQLAGFSVSKSSFNFDNTLGSQSYDEWKNSHDITSDPIDKQDKIAKKMKAIYGAEYAKY